MVLQPPTTCKPMSKSSSTALQSETATQPERNCTHQHGPTVAALPLTRCRLLRSPATEGGPTRSRQDSGNRASASPECPLRRPSPDRTRQPQRLDDVLFGWMPPKKPPISA